MNTDDACNNPVAWGDTGPLSFSVREVAKIERELSGLLILIRRVAPLVLVAQVVPIAWGEETS
ncbi:hypothetical protein VN12_19480 [Pirellula sp. SH-Sr6A]|uniref:hypothetical protein n=1 Tax=Pirellula sp. SH-Sr6A TaxID=1632865 RepID=UPI00078E84FC|nr:hypothetical protein [Pirellula sp. SH-Sr6A]AMV34316.1 hypothetical protein VN12_19480 [Pirellula sp. SH-Sr6A]